MRRCVRLPRCVRPTRAPGASSRGVRFAQQRWSESAALAREALARDGTSVYAADVLASSLFMMDDVEGAIRAWNITGAPRLDSVHISGLTRTRYALVAEALALEPDTTLSADQYRLARRRAASMPDLSSTRLSPSSWRRRVRGGGPGGRRTAVAAAATRSSGRPPRRAQALTARWRSAFPGAPARARRGRQAGAGGRTGRRLRVQFAAPRLTTPRGVWRVGLSWDAQAYGTVTRPRARGAHARRDRTRQLDEAGPAGDTCRGPGRLAVTLTG